MAKNFRQIGLTMIFVFSILSASDCGAAARDKSAEEEKRDLQMDQLVLQRKILATMDLYEEFSKDSIEREKDLKKLLGDIPYSEDIDASFQSGKTSIDLIPAQSAWMIWSDLEADRWSIRLWLDEQAQKNNLGQLDTTIRTITRRIQMGKVLTKEDLDEIAKARLDYARGRTIEEDPAKTHREEGKAQGDEYIKKRMSNNKGGETKWVGRLSIGCPFG